MSDKKEEQSFDAVLWLNNNLVKVLGAVVGLLIALVCFVAYQQIQIIGTKLDIKDFKSYVSYHEKIEDEKDKHNDLIFEGYNEAFKDMKDNLKILNENAIRGN